MKIFIAGGKNKKKVEDDIISEFVFKKLKKLTLFISCGQQIQP